MIPEKSQANIKDGIWFVYEDGNNVIKIWGSSISGKEKVFLNETLVSEKRSMRMKSEHAFSDSTGSKYIVTFTTTNLMKGILECKIFRNDEQIKTFKSKFQIGKSFSLKRILILVLAGVLFATIKRDYNLPDISFWIFLIIVLVINFRIREKDEIVNDE